MKTLLFDDLDVKINPSYPGFMPESENVPAISFDDGWFVIHYGEYEPKPLGVPTKGFMVDRQFFNPGGWDEPDSVDVDTVFETTYFQNALGFVLKSMFDVEVENTLRYIGAEEEVEDGLGE